MRYVCPNCGAAFSALPPGGRCAQCDAVLRPDTDAEQPEETSAHGPVPQKKTH